jgi:hypothetical protein
MKIGRRTRDDGRQLCPDCRFCSHSLNREGGGGSSREDIHVKGGLCFCNDQ